MPSKSVWHVVVHLCDTVVACQQVCMHAKVRQASNTVLQNRSPTRVMPLTDQRESSRSSFLIQSHRLGLGALIKSMTIFKLPQRPKLTKIGLAARFEALRLNGQPPFGNQTGRSYFLGSWGQGDSHGRGSKQFGGWLVVFRGPESGDVSLGFL